MELSASKPRVTSLLANDVLARVERLRLNANRRFTNRVRGEHVAKRSGSSIEFKDYRDYAPGDDMRFVDWNIFSRLHRPYVKLFHEEEEMHVVLLIDASSSMKFEGKLDRAKELAAAFGVMSLRGTEKVSVCVFNEKEGKVQRLRRLAGRGSMRMLFRFLEPIEGGGDAPIEAGIESMLKEHRGKGVVVLLSDFLTTGDLRRVFTLLHSEGLEIFGVQILGPTEIDPDVTSDVRLVDSETGAMLDISAGDEIVRLYNEYREAFERHLSAMAQSRSGKVITVNAKDPLDFVLFDLLRRRGWIR